MIRKSSYKDIELISSAPEGRAGCLTDGKRWDFVYLKPAREQKPNRESEEEVDGYEVYETRNLGAQKKEEIKRIMGITLRFKWLTNGYPRPFRLKIFSP